MRGAGYPLTGAWSATAVGAMDFRTWFNGCGAPGSVRCATGLVGRTRALGTGRAASSFVLAAVFGETAPTSRNQIDPVGDRF